MVRRRARALAAAASAIRARVGGDFPPLYGARLERVRDAGEAALGDAERVWAEGSRLAVEDAVGLAFGASSPRPASPAGMSARDLEVARLVAEGLSNKAIAARLRLSVRTVESQCDVRSPSSASIAARSSPPGRASAVSSGSVIALMTVGRRRPTVRRSPLRSRARGGETNERTNDGALPDTREPRPEPGAGRAGLRSRAKHGAGSPGGARLVLARPANPGWRVISVWGSDAARERFFAPRPRRKQAGLSLEGVKPTRFEVESLVAGDLIGAAHPF